MGFQEKNRELEEEVQNLNALVESFALLNSSIDLETVLLNTLKKATELMKAEIGSIALLNDEKTHLIFLESTDPNFDKLKDFKVPLGQGIAGNVALNGIPVRVDDVRNDPRFYGKIDQAMNQKTQSYLCVPLMVEETIIGTAQLMNRLDGTSFTEKDEKLMEGFSKQAALAIQNAKLHEFMIKQKAIESELKVCREIQQKLYPKSVPKIDGFEVFGSSIPSKEVGGDYFTYILRNDDSLDIFIADVSGKGISAAMMVSELHSGLQILSQQNLQLDTMVKTLNDHLVDSLILGKFITLFAGRMRPDYNIMEYSIAGHPPPYLINQSGSVRRLEVTGKILGLTKGVFTRKKIKFEPNDLLVSFSDGYSEAQNKQMEEFGENAIVEIAKLHANKPLEVIAEQLNSAVEKFSEGLPAHDDKTLLLVRKF